MAKQELIRPTDLEGMLREQLMSRRLPDAFLYVNGCAENWLALDESEEFDIASELTELLRNSAGTIAESLPAGTNLLSIGVGDGSKERILLEAMRDRRPERFVAVDVAGDMVDAALRNVEGLCRESLGVVTFCEDLARYRSEAASPTLLCLLGNNFSNYEPQPLLENLQANMTDDDALLLDCQVLPVEPARQADWQRHFEHAYNSPANASFNLGPLVAHGLEEADVAFCLDLIRAETPAGQAVRTRKRITVLQDATLCFAEGPMMLSAGETIEMGFTYKYTAIQVRDLLAAAGFSVAREFASAEGDYFLVLARPA